MKKIIIILSLVCLYVVYLHIKIADLEANNLQLKNQIAKSLKGALTALESKKIKFP